MTGRGLWKEPIARFGRLNAYLRAASRNDAGVAAVDADAARFVHLGATSQDVIDTALALLTRKAVALIDDDLARLVDALTALAARHRTTPMLGRTLMQPAEPTSFGAEVMAWLVPLVRGRERLRQAAGGLRQPPFHGKGRQSQHSRR